MSWKIGVLKKCFCKEGFYSFVILSISYPVFNFCFKIMSMNKNIFGNNGSTGGFTNKYADNFDFRWHLGIIAIFYCVAQS